MIRFVAKELSGSDSLREITYIEQGIRMAPFCIVMVHVSGYNLKDVEILSRKSASLSK
jgi:hypothetical protein